MATFAIERLSNYSYNKLMSSEVGLFRIVEILQNTVAIDDGDVSNTVSIDHITLVATLITAGNVVNKAKNRSKTDYVLK